MALHCHIWLVLLASIISQCGAIEYYVKPTDFTNITCPGQPCLTINEYTNASAYYIKSNIAFIFLPGNHISLSPIVIRDVENISIISDNKNTKILAYFSCRDVINSTCIHCPMVPIPEFDDVSLQACCSVIRLVNVVNASVTGIDIEMNSSGIMGITLQHSSNLHIQTSTVCIKDIHIFKYSCGIGIFAYNSSQMHVGPLHTFYHSTGILLHMTYNTTIQHFLCLNSLRYGLMMSHTDKVSLINANILNNAYGMKLWSASNTAFEQVHVDQNLVELQNCSKTYIKNMFTAQNCSLVLTLHLCRETTIVNIFARGNQSQLSFHGCTDLTMLNVLIDCQESAQSFNYSNNLHLQSTMVHSSYNGNTIHIVACFNTTMAHVYSRGSLSQNGIYLSTSTNTTLSHISVTTNKNGIMLDKCTDTTMTNVSVMEYAGSGIKVREGVVMEKSTKVIIKNVSITPFEIAGLSFADCSKVTLEHSIFSHSHSTTASVFLTQPVILSLKDTDINLRHSTFVENNTTCIRAIHSKVKVQGTSPLSTTEHYPEQHFFWQEVVC